MSKQGSITTKSVTIVLAEGESNNKYNHLNEYIGIQINFPVECRQLMCPHNTSP